MITKYNINDKVMFLLGNLKEGIIRIVDPNGTFEQDDEPSYDIFVEEENCLYKHINESRVLGLAENFK